ncbi:outer membrane beta-barrel protein [Tamlana crocina]|uniref:Porin family protein n=1 Tax=Tamlana crocina TaxID=393006 RepID=A0ABX1DAI7_9FLAO|nr:outer membrane beta-barrel protein [Tamlana crocina]NJX15375.1 porin family protein [Tamlana crocina]
MLRKTFSLFIIFLITASTQAQELNLAATAGYLNLNSIFKVDGEKWDLDFDSSGFYIGAQSEFEITDEINLKPELLVAINNEGNTLYLGFLGGYEITEEFSVLAGPSINYLLEEVVDNYSKLGVFITFGAEYSFTEKIYAQAKYGVQLNNFYTGTADLSSKINFLLFGVGYKFL